MLYSLFGLYPSPLPNRIVLSDGRVRTDKNSFTDEEIADAGYVAVSDPPGYVWPDQLEWTGTEWNVRPPNTVEVAVEKQKVLDKIKTILADTDYRVIKALESNIPLDPLWSGYRQDLRSLYNDIEQNLSDVFNIIWPIEPYGEI